MLRLRIVSSITNTPRLVTVDKAYIIIDPLQPPMPDDYADNDWLTEEHLIQIDIWSKSREEKDKLGERIQNCNEKHRVLPKRRRY